MIEQLIHGPAVAVQMLSMNENYLQNGFVMRFVDHYCILLLNYYQITAPSLQITARLLLDYCKLLLDYCKLLLDYCIITSDYC